jgi:uncharacterized membrane protein
MADLTKLNYLPLALPFFAILAGVFLALVVLVEVGALRYAYIRLGVSSRFALLLLLASLIGSYVNVVVAQLPEREIVSGQEVAFYGMHYVIPVVAEWPGTVIAVNIGGAVIPALLSLYLLIRHQIWLRAAVATAVVAAVVHWLARPVPGLGIAVPIFVPPIATAAIALLLSPRRAAPLAYVSGSLGTLIGADLLNLGNIQGLGAPIASIGGAGTFDGIFLTGILAVLFASLTGQPGRRDRTPAAKPVSNGAPD